ncbi:MAG TPA: sigma-70 family RNA polymerase sigma factor [Labilithrix sp.]|nr:sigma-70 family RNA polymerase sigma factor [Labilithrix sp.]
MAPSEHDLIEAARAGDAPALEALLTLHAPAVLRFGQKMCRHPEDAQDVLQEALLAAARGVHDFRGDASFATWLFTIVRSFCIKKRRVSKFAPAETVSLDHDTSAARLASSAPLPDEAAADQELSQALSVAIGELEEANREVLLLRDVEGMTAPEVASILGISVEAVKSRLHRARIQVRARLEPLLPPLERVTAASPECPEIALLFSRYLEGEIGQAECDAMQKHVASCARCRAGCDSLKHTLALCHSSAGGARKEVSAEVQALVRKALRELSTRPLGA